MMDSDFTDQNSPLDFESLLIDAVNQVVIHENPQRFLQWMQDHLPDYDNGNAPELERSSAMYTALASSIGRIIWNAVPLPGNHFKPQPLPAPGRNDICPCGSGRKYKQCCMGAPQLPPISSDEVWPLLVEVLPEKVLKLAIKEKHIPVVTLMMMAQDFLLEDRPRKGVALLEPLFSGATIKTDDRYDYALNTLCNLYDSCGFHQKKLSLLNHIIDVVPRSPLRAGAWQRMACIRIDQDDVEGAWEAFTHAQRDNPDSAEIGILEVQLLLAGHRHERAQERAQFWVMRLRRQGLMDDESPLDFLLELANDPMQAMGTVSLEQSGNTGRRLQQWLQRVENRPLPIYKAISSNALEGDDEEEDDERLRSSLESIGVSMDQINQALEDFKKEISYEDSDTDIFSEPRDTLTLVSPNAIVDLELQWHEIFPLEKPFSTHEVPFDAIDVWQPEIEEEWMAFLEAYPQAFDSLDILDDIATALTLHDQMGTPWMDKLLLEQILRRSKMIVEKALDDIETPRLVWLYEENRPALRSLARLIWLYQRKGEDLDAWKVTTLLMTLNPDDNHGFRMVMMNYYLRNNDNENAVALASQFSDDMTPEIAYGEVLALFRLDRLDEAQVALETAIKRLPKIVRYLRSKRVKKPKFDLNRIQYGGDDQAWLYRDAMRDIWEGTPGVLDWLKKHAKR